MRVTVFGTYDTAAHPRVAVIADGLRAHGHEVQECNAPLGLDTAARVAILAQPWRVPLLIGALARRWLDLVRIARRQPRPDLVLVGYLGHFDVRLARRLFRRTPIVLDHLIGASDTARDRQLSGRLRQVLLRAIDAGALRCADVVVVDTDEHLQALPPAHRERAVVVPVGAPTSWFDAAVLTDAPETVDPKTVDPETDDPETDDAAPPGSDERPLRVLFFGLYTPLQGTPVIGRALAQLAGAPIVVTMVGKGQDAAETRSAAAGNSRVRWLDWVAAEELATLTAQHDVCLGIFGVSPKALRVVPNKVFQGAAAGCAIVTSDTPAQRRLLGDAACFVPPGDAGALAEVLLGLAADRAALHKARAAARTLALRSFTPEQIVKPLIYKIGETDASAPQVPRPDRAAMNARNPR
jgi:glycosyltransferase involved in cell wall biosynthesis